MTWSPMTSPGLYLFLEPESRLRADNGQRAVGYVIGTASTPDFVAGVSRRWLRGWGRHQPLSARR